MVHHDLHVRSEWLKRKLTGNVSSDKHKITILILYALIQIHLRKVHQPIFARKHRRQDVPDESNVFRSSGEIPTTPFELAVIDSKDVIKTYRGAFVRPVHPLAFSGEDR